MDVCYKWVPAVKEERNASVLIQRERGVWCSLHHSLDMFVIKLFILVLEWNLSSSTLFMPVLLIVTSMDKNKAMYAV